MVVKHLSTIAARLEVIKVHHLRDVWAFHYAIMTDLKSWVCDILQLLYCFNKTIAPLNRPQVWKPFHNTGTSQHKSTPPKPVYRLSFTEQGVYTHSYWYTQTESNWSAFPELIISSVSRQAKYWKKDKNGVKQRDGLWGRMEDCKVKEGWQQK